MKIRHTEDYRTRRRREYPAVGDQLDVVMKLACALKDQGVELPAEVQEWIDCCHEVKAKYPKG